jgi:predicted glutamine amidotransferase
MCVIAVKSLDATLDQTAMETLKRCWDENPDGAGFMFVDGDEVVIHKGYMSWRAFRRAVNRQRLAERGTVVFHFRIATQGVIDSEACHPFPVSDNIRDLKARSIRSSSAVAHNGIITSMPKHKRYSDTQLFIRDVFAQTDMEDGIKEMFDTGSKFAVMTPDEVTLVGKFIDEDGWSYSNESYMDWEQWADDDDTLSPNLYGTTYGRPNLTDDWDDHGESFPLTGYKDSSGKWHEFTDAEYAQIEAEADGEIEVHFPCMDCSNEAGPMALFCEECAWARGITPDDAIEFDELEQEAS